MAEKYILKCAYCGKSSGAARPGSAFGGPPATSPPPPVPGSRNSSDKKHYYQWVRV